MIWENTKILLKLYYRPLAAMSNMIDEGNWLYGAIAVAALSFVFQMAVTARLYEAYGTATTAPVNPYTQYMPRPGSAPLTTQAADDEFTRYEDYDDDYFFTYNTAALGQRQLPLVGRQGLWLLSFTPSSFLTSVIMLCVFYVPATILLLVLLEPLGSFGLVLRRDYGTLLACTLMAWTAAHLPFTVAGLVLAERGVDANVMLLLWLASTFAFGALMVCALRIVFGASFTKAIATVSVSWVSISLGSHLFAYVSPYLFSPFILFYAYMYFRGELGTIGTAYRHRQNFRRFLDQATINPRDAEAHYQLGIVYQQRRQESEAVARFTRAIEIDGGETDAHFQLGRIARERGRLQEAIDRFNIVLTQDERHSHNEIWREIGATYVAASMHDEARTALERYLERRPFDPEGLYYMGRSLQHLGHHTQAQEMFGRCIEAVQTMPSYRRSQLRKWRKLAQDQLSSATHEQTPLANVSST